MDLTKKRKGDMLHKETKGSKKKKIMASKMD
jgi:hypothetical protein